MARIAAILIILLSAPISAGTLGWALQDIDEIQKRADTAYEAGEYKAARKQYIKLASLGSKFAQYRLSLIHLQGLGVEKDAQEAYAWATVASEFGGERMKEHQAGILQLIPANQHDDTKELAAKFLARYSNQAVMKRIYQQARREDFKRIGRGVLPESFVGIVEPCDTPEAQGAGGIGSGGSAASCGSIASTPGADTALSRLAKIAYIRQVFGDMIEGGYVELGDFEVIEDEVPSDESPSADDKP